MQGLFTQNGAGIKFSTENVLRAPLLEQIKKQKAHDMACLFKVEKRNIEAIGQDTGGGAFEVLNTVLIVHAELKEREVLKDLLGDQENETNF